MAGGSFVKRGTLVKVNDGGNPCRGTIHWLYGGDEKCWDDRNSLNPTDIPFGSGDIGVVLKVRKIVPGKYTQSYVKILTTKGIGWIFLHMIEMVK
jgi:hypothetical protein